jgi:hypothetical protein
LYLRKQVFVIKKRFLLIFMTAFITMATDGCSGTETFKAEVEAYHPKERIMVIRKIDDNEKKKPEIIQIYIPKEIVFNSELPKVKAINQVLPGNKVKVVNIKDKNNNQKVIEVDVLQRTEKEVSEKLLGGETEGRRIVVMLDRFLTESEQQNLLNELNGINMSELKFFLVEKNYGIDFKTYYNITEFPTFIVFENGKFKKQTSNIEELKQYLSM